MDENTFFWYFTVFVIGLNIGAWLKTTFGQSVWQRSARNWRKETMIQKKRNGELGQVIWEYEQLITKCQAEKAVAIDMLAPIVLENESLKNKLRELGYKA